MIRPLRDNVRWLPGYHARAEFRHDDPQELVDASFACPRCLGQAGIPRLMSAGKPWTMDTIALCRCPSCGEAWTLLLDFAQTLRLTQVTPWHQGGHQTTAE